MASGPTEKLARFVVNTKFEDMPEQAVRNTKVRFVDTIGVAVAGAAVGNTGQIATKYVEEIGGAPEASVIGSGFRTSAPNAAFVNSLLAHALDFDDWGPQGHPSSVLVATSLALGEKLGLSGRAVIEAYILGLEVYEKIAAGSDVHTAWHTTAVYGTLGAAAAASKLLGLSLKQTMMSLGIAASSAGGMLREHGTMTKPYQVGKAARSGVEAALLAGAGFTGDEAIVEGPGGFCDCFFGEENCDYAKMVQGLGDPFFIVSPGLGIKLYPCGGIKYYQRIEAVLELKREHGFSCDDVDWLEVRVTKQQNEFSISEPKTGLEGKFSGRYLCARALLDGNLTLDMFSDAEVTRPEVKDALRKIRMIVAENIPEERSKTWNSATIKLKDGRTFSQRVDIPRGDRRNPVPIAFILEKYRRNAALALSQQEVERTAELLQNLGQIEHIRELMDIINLRRIV